jgi:hypothetical protein
MERHLLGFLLVAMRSTCLGVQSIGEEVLMHVYAVSPGNLVLNEACGGLVVIVLFAAFFSASSSTAASLLAVGSLTNAMCVFSLVFACAIQNVARLLVIRGHSAMVYQLAGGLVPGAVLVFGALAYTFSGGLIGGRPGLKVSLSRRL